MKGWNKAHPEHEYSDVRNFRQAYNETYELLIYPAYNPPNWRPYAPTPAQDYRQREAETVFKEAKKRRITHRHPFEAHLSLAVGQQGTEAKLRLVGILETRYGMKVHKHIESGYGCGKVMLRLAEE